MRGKRSGAGWAVVLLAVAATAPGCGDKKPEDGLAAYRELQTQLKDVEPGEQVTRLEAFVRDHRNTKEAGWAAQRAAGILLGDLDKDSDAVALMRNTLEGTDDAEARAELQRSLAWVLGEAGHAADLEVLRGSIAAERELGWRDFQALARAGASAGAWELALREADAGLAAGSRDAIAATMDKDTPQERIDRVVRWIQEQNLIVKGRALLELGRSAEALPVFAEADQFTERNILGLASGSEIDRYWARALASVGDVEAALERIARAAVYDLSDDDVATAREIFAARSGSDEGFESYLRSARETLVRSAPDFTLPDYEGVEVTLSSLAGKVVLLDFWFPT